MFDINGKQRLNCYEPCLLQNIVSYFFLDWSCLLCMYHTWKTMYELRLVKSAFYTRLLLIHLRPLQSNDTRTLQVDPRTFVWFESGRISDISTPSPIHPIPTKTFYILHHPTRPPVSPPWKQPSTPWWSLPVGKCTLISFNYETKRRKEEAPRD